MKHKQHGFTIVELLIVVVVIAILASITIVAYNGIQSRARTSALQSNLKTLSKGIETYKIQNSDTYPASLAAANISMPTSGSYTYQSGGTSYCLDGTDKGITYKVDATNNIPIQGSCVVALTCPTGYIVVPGNSNLGTADFCLMKYEARNVGGVATSQYSGTPWASISQSSALTTAAAACTGCHLMTEAEWMTVAGNVLSVASNWSSGTVGTGYIYQGHINSAPANALDASSSDTDGLYGMTTTGGVNNNNRRYLTLTNGEVIWDLSGNMSEWTQSTIGSGEQPGLSGEVAYAWKQWTNASLLMNNLPTISRPASLATTSGLSNVASWTYTEGVGQLFSKYNETSTMAYLRGGRWSNAANAGVLTLALSNLPSYSDIYIGFRVAK